MIHLIILLFMLNTNIFSQELKFKNELADNKIALIISNNGPAFTEIRDVIADLQKKDLAVALVPKDYCYDLSKLSITNTPFDSKINYITKVSVLIKTPTEQQIHTTVEILRLSDQKYIKKNVTVPRSNPRYLSTTIEELFQEFLPKKPLVNPTIVSVDQHVFSFAKSDFPGLRRGDEITIRYNESRNQKTESIATVQGFSNELVLAKDIRKNTIEGDIVLRSTPRRNRFNMNLGVTVPLLGQDTLIASSGENLWRDSKRWPVGFKIEGEYERFLPYQLVSTTAFGIQVDRTLYTSLVTGIGYRGIVGLWEFVPYIRLGVSYNALGLQTIEGSSGPLQGFALSVVINLGFNTLYRVSQNIFVGFDVGMNYFPTHVIAVKSDNQTVKPSWKNEEFSSTFSRNSLFPYVNLKVGWLF